MKKLSYTFVIILTFIWIGVLFSFAISKDTPMGSISGKVISRSTGKPVYGAKIYHPTIDGRYTKTDRNGNYELKNVPEGRYSVNVYAADYEYSYQYNVNVFEAEQTKNINFSLYAKAPYFYVYMDKDVFTPKTKPSFVYRGYKVKEFSIKIYKLAGISEILGANNNAKAYDYDAYAANVGNVKRVHDSTVKTKPDEFGEFEQSQKIDLGEKGYYVAVIKPDIGQEERLGFNITDIGIVVKRSPGKMLVYAVNLLNGGPVQGVTARLCDETEVISVMGATDKNGLLTSNNPGNAAYNIVASKEGSYALARAYSGDSANKYKVYMYTERPVYRPAQTVYYKGILRRDLFSKYENAADKNVEIEVTDNEGNIIEKTNASTDSFGTFNGKFNLGEEAELGAYSIKATVDGEEFFREFKVAEYKKPEYKVTLTPQKQRYTSGEEIVVDVNSAYYFGEPVRGAEITYTVYESPYYAWWRDYGEGDFDNEGYGNVIANGTLKTNGDGLAQIKIPTGKSERDRMIGVEVEIKDASLRSVENSVSILVTRGSFDINIKPDRYVYSADSTGNFEIKVADYDNKAVPQLKIKTDIYRVEYVEGESQYTEKETLVKSAQALTDGKGIARVECKFDKTGTYKIKASAFDEKKNEVISDYYVWVSSLYSSEPVSKNIEIIADKKLYNIGDKAKVLINLPWKDATVLLTVEGRDIHLAKTYKISGFSKTIELPVEAQYFPNVYVEISLVKDEQLVYRSVPIYLNTSGKNLKVAVTPSKKEYKPGEEAIYDLAVTDGKGRPAVCELSLGVVDEAIYAINEDESGDIKKYFYGYRERLVSTNYSFSSYYSGGADKEAVKIRKKFEDTAYFNPTVVTDENGRARVKFMWPENLTSWRATVKAVTKDTFVGQAVNNVTVSKDLIVNLEVPRFITQRDELEIAGVVHNYTDKDVNVDVNFKAEGCTLVDKPSKTVKVAKNQNLRVPFMVKAESPGVAVFTISATCPADSDGMELKVPILPHGVEQVQAGSAVVEDSANIDLNIKGNTVAGASELAVNFSPSVGSAMLSSLDYLVNYPYGCTEQTMNSFMPAVVVKKTLDRLNIVMTGGPSLQNKITKVTKQGLDKIYSYQHADGGWGWWEYDDSNAYLTAFVVMGLNEAKNAGIKVDDYSFNRGVAALKGFLKQKEEDFVHTNNIYEQNGYVNARAYLLYALSECSYVDRKEITDLLQHKNGLNNYSKALLCLALANTNASAQAKDLLAEIEKGAAYYGDTCHWQSNSTRYSWTDSDTETTAYVLKAMVKLDPDNADIIKCFNWLNIERRGMHWESTKDTAVVLGALCDYLIAKGDASPNFTASVYLNEELINKTVFNNIADSPVEFTVGTGRRQSLQFKKEGQGRLFAGYRLKYFTDEENIKPKSDGITVERQYYKLDITKDFKGNYLEKPSPFNGQVKPGEKIQVKITINCPEDYRYVLIEDMLPAGCEVDIAEGEKNIGSLWWQKRIVRDEKAAFFSTRMDKGKHELTYNLRCEIPGDYHILPANAYLMYCPQVRGYSSEGRLRIR